jgi:hypothetical protein
LDEIVAEEESLRTRLAAARSPEPEQEAAALASVPAMLEKLREKLDAGITWDLRRQLVEVLVDGIRIDTVDAGNRREAVVNVRYRFVSSLHACTDRGSCHKRDLSLNPECRTSGSALIAPQQSWNEECDPRGAVGLDPGGACCFRRPGKLARLGPLDTVPERKPS